MQRFSEKRKKQENFWKSKLSKIWKNTQMHLKEQYMN